jgi:hypothetical protein
VNERQREILSSVIDVFDFFFFSSENETIYLHLCGLSCLLKLICDPYFSLRMTPDDFLIIMTLLRVSRSRMILFTVDSNIVLLLIYHQGSIVDCSSTYLS